MDISLKRAPGAIKSLSANKNTSSTSSSGDLIFPLEMRSASLQNKPVILFECFNSVDIPNERIYLPTPAGISFSDSANYSSIDLGGIGGVIYNATKRGLGTAAAGGTALETAGAAGSAVLDAVTAKNVAAIASKTLGIDKMAGFVTKSVINPNTNTTFESNPIRTFSFSFKLIASSDKESELIRLIHTKFRQYTYAQNAESEDTLLLSYPPIWTIKFFDMSTGEENPYIPRIYSCYLTQVQSTFNSGGNMYYSNNAPLEVDISLTFQESRSLTRKDLIDMENDQLANRGIDPDTNQPTVLEPPSSSGTKTPAPQTTGGLNVD